MATTLATHQATEKVPPPKAAPSNCEPSIVAVIGAGYVGLQLALEFGSHYEVLAFDISLSRIKELGSKFKSHPRITPTSDPKRLTKATHFLISVPTLVLPDKNIDTSALAGAITAVARYSKPGCTVVVESSVSVGMTRALLSPLIHSHSLKGGMSPELINAPSKRVDPGRTSPAYTEIPKIISGLDDIAPGSLESISQLYSKVFPLLVPVSSPEVAEMTKLYENCQRMVGIAYANELADACHELNICPYEVSQAAATKPFGYMPFTPSLGVGGHCIPVNPYYLFASMSQSNSSCDDKNEKADHDLGGPAAKGLSFPILRLATDRMRQRPAAIGDRLMASVMKSPEWRSAALSRGVGSGSGSGNLKPRVLVVGIAFKAGQGVLSNSPGLLLMNHLHCQWYADLRFADPLVKQEAVPGGFKKLDESREWNRKHLSSSFDIIVVAMKQLGLDFSVLDQVKKLRGNKTWVQYCCQ
ncbi:nucleotide sugar dehydrogenase [Zalerion maritima]|uniref:Nucleotide sugar dehydrogenase n=1 Tax=Zalerion maritima TaxID=339359 RepID=A0AAD5S0Y8_9PEZI|nr:nucleotide sugar dehydrogenase [Zalerion maritima]